MKKISLIIIFIFAFNNAENIKSKDIANLIKSPLIDFQTLETVIRNKTPKSIEDNESILLKVITLFDASTKIQSGFLAGSFYDFGNFDQCYNAQFGEEYGKYCLAIIKFPDGVVPLSKSANFTRMKQIMTENGTPGINPRLAQFGADYMGWMSAVCGLSSMTATEINQYVPLSTVIEETCVTKAVKRELTSGAITTIIIVAIALGCAIVGTVYDLVLQLTDKKPVHELLTCFSVIKNGKKIIAASNNPEQLLCLNGIKALSMMWVIIGHEYSNAGMAPLSNPVTIFTSWKAELKNMYIMGAPLSVDTFFFVGGLVTVYTFLRATKRGVKFNIVMYYLHRFLRLTPVFAIVVLFHMHMFQYLQKAPFSFVLQRMLVDACEKNWWKQLFYLNNFFKDSGCVAQAWYLSVDFQLFLLSPIVLLPLVKFPKLAQGLLGVLIAAGCVVPLTIAWTIPLGSMLTDKEYNFNYYAQTYARFGPYVMGMYFGYIIYSLKQEKDKPKLSPVVVGCLWGAALGIMFSCVFATHDIFTDVAPEVVANAFYIGFQRNAWSLAIGIVIFLLTFGYGKVIDDFLSAQIFQFLTKLSYSMYLVHYELIIIRNGLSTERFKFSNWSMAHVFWGDFMFTLAISLGLTLLFESPVIVLEKYLFILIDKIGKLGARMLCLTRIDKVKKPAA